MNKFSRVLTSLALAMAVAIPAARGEDVEVFKRDLQQVSFIPKGQWITGVSVGYTMSSQDNYQFFIFENVKGDTYSFKVTPMALYSFKDNLAAGLKFGYERSKAQLDSGDLNFSSDTNISADKLYSIRSNYYATAAFRQYFSLGSSRRFGFFNELQLQLGGGQSKYSDYTGPNEENRHIEGTFERNFSLNVGLTPGFIMFLNNYSAIEVNIGVLGFGYTHTKAITNQVQVSRRNSSNANFKINLFSVQFGMAFYL
ncbi:MAG: hypothetical protein HDR89_04075 [Bacteroides sp.]|nr:hypothetical protein [Bacteroides sp.]MBD5350043.1 hypothetical protein [Bacteroides sp.]MDE6038669.1 hypothetical protein [Paramuribaculum sp.]MDE6050950.1 hypothetical protein [Paramuribaculum sp.]